MSFKIHTIDNASVLPIEELPASAIVPEVGMALIMSGGQLVKATGTTKPAYICVTHRDAAVAEGENIQVLRVNPGTIFETTFAAAATAVKAGSKVTIHTDAMNVTATTEGGVAEIVAMNGTAAGDSCLVRFP